jgi:DNA-binding IclR family transcriptional regulator
MQGTGRRRRVEPTPKDGAESRAIPRSAPTRTLEKGLFLLGLFDVDHPEWTLKEIRERAELTKATARRLVKTLEAAQWVAYDAASGTYHLGSSALRALYLATSHAELVRVAHPHLVALADETTESCSLSVWTDAGPLIVDTVLTPRLFRPRTYIGMLLDGLASADAKALVAFGPVEAWDRLLAPAIEPKTARTITDPERVREMWRTARREGVAFDLGEWNIEAPAVAAPVVDGEGHVRATVSVVVPIERSAEDVMLSHAEAVKRTADAIAAKLG